MRSRLSHTVPSQAAIAADFYSRHLQSRPRFLTTRLIAQRYLDNFGFADLIACMLLIAITYWHACLWHTVLAGPVDSSRFNSTVAEVVGALVGILLAIVVFSVQLHAGRVDKGALAVPYLVRLHRVYPILALGTGITLANVGLTTAVDLIPNVRTQLVLQRRMVTSQAGHRTSIARA